MSTEVQQMFDGISRRYDLANDVLSFGMHRLWRRILAKEAKLTPGLIVLDLCAGTGDVAFELARGVGPSGRVFGLDFVHSMLQIANQKKSRRPEYSCVTFLQGDAMALPIAAHSVHVATISFGIRNVDDPLACLREIKRILVPGGKLLVLEFGQPRLPGFSHLYEFYGKYFMPQIGQLLTGDRNAYEYLPRTARTFPAGNAFLDLLKNAGFFACRQRALLSGVAYLYHGVSPANPQN